MQGKDVRSRYDDVRMRPCTVTGSKKGHCIQPDSCIQYPFLFSSSSGTDILKIQPDQAVAVLVPGISHIDQIHVSCLKFHHCPFQRDCPI